MESLIQKLNSNCWIVDTPFKFMKGIELGNRMVIFRLSECLVICNGVELSEELLIELQAFEKSQGLKFRFLFSPGGLTDGEIG